MSQYASTLVAAWLRGYTKNTHMTGIETKSNNKRLPSEMKRHFKHTHNKQKRS